MFNLSKIKFQSALPAFFVLAALLLLSGCKKGSSQTIGVAIPSEIKPVKLETVLTNPSQFNGKQIVMKGVITGQCPSYCELFIRDGAQKAILFAEDFKFPKLESGKPVSVFANVTTGPDNVVFSALGVRVEEGNNL